MADAKTLEELAEPDYWNARYAKPADSETFEWFKSYKNLEAFFAKHMPRADDNAQPRILHLGCGNSVRGTPSLEDSDFQLTNKPDAADRLVQNWLSQPARGRLLRCSRL